MKARAAARPDSRPREARAFAESPHPNEDTTMTVKELMRQHAATLDAIAGGPLEPDEALIQKLARIATDRGIPVGSIDLAEAALTDEDRAMMKPTLLERAERYRQEEMPPIKPLSATQRMPIMPKREDGWWIDNREANDPTMPEMGPYETKQEAKDARASILRSRLLKPEDVVTSPEDRPAKPKRSRKTNSEPVPGVPGQDNEAQEGTTEAATSESKGTNMAKAKTAKKIEHPKKNAKAGKPTKEATATAKAAKAPKAKAAKKEPAGEKKLGALDAAAKVLKGRTNPMTTGELILAMADRGLWTSPGGKTPEATLSAAMNREIAKKGSEARFKKVGPGAFLANA